MDFEIEPAAAAEVLRKAEFFVVTVERVFSLDESSMGSQWTTHAPDDSDKVSEPVVGVAKTQSKDAQLPPISLEETRRHARENWLRLRQQGKEGAARSAHDRESSRDAREDQGLSLGGDLDE